MSQIIFPGHQSSKQLQPVRTSQIIILGRQSLWQLHPIRTSQKKNSGLPITQTASANQNVTNNMLWEKPNQWLLLCWIPKPKQSNRAMQQTTGGFLRKPSEQIMAHFSLMTRDNCYQMRQITFIWFLDSDSEHCAFHQSTWQSDWKLLWW